MKNKLQLLLMTLICLGCLNSIGADKKLNVMFIVCDDLNTRVSTSGYQHISTPAQAQWFTTMS